MKTQKKLLVLIDGTERSRQTIDYLAQLAPFRDAQVVLFHVHSGIPECYWDLEKTPQNQQAITQMIAWEQRQKNEIETFAENARKTLVDAGYRTDRVEVRIQKRQIGIARDILREAEEGAYTAVVMRRRGVGAIEGIVVGSVANKLFARLTCCPVIIAGQKEPNDKLLIAIDGSPSSMKAVDFVAENVGGHGYGVGLVYVIRGFGSLVPESPEFMMPTENVELAHTEMMRLFSDVREKLVLAGFDENRIEEKIITGVYSRAGAIVEAASTGGYSAIVVGRKGLSRVQEFFMGRVSLKVIQGGRKFTVWMI